jgi:acyl carrier protein
MANVSERMTRLIKEKLKIGEQQLLPNARFREDLKATSLALILLQVAMEEEFNIELKEEDALGIVSLQTALEYLSSRGIKD